HPTRGRGDCQPLPTPPVVPPAPPPDLRAAPNPRRETPNHKGVRAQSASLRPRECGRLLLRRYVVRPVPRRAPPQVRRGVRAVALQPAPWQLRPGSGLARVRGD